MDLPTDLQEFPGRQQHVSSDTATWPGPIALKIDGYLSREPPPAHLVSSVRALVFREDHVLVMRNRDGTHIHPGGRVEEGETHEETLRRELLEEAGVEIDVLRRLGFVHLKHTTPKPRDHPYPYPDFIWPIYAASFTGWKPEAKIEDDYEVSCRFMPVRDVVGIGLTDHEKEFLRACLAMTGDALCAGS